MVEVLWVRPMKDSGVEWIGDIPENWDVHFVKYAFSEVKNKNYDGKEKNALKFTNGEIVKKENFKADEDEYIADTILNYTVVNPNTIMINGLNLNYDLKSLRVGIVPERGIITSAYLALEPDEQKIYPQYANLLFKGYESKMALHNMGVGIRLTLGYKEFKRQPILVPPLYEQYKIAGFLKLKCTEIDNAISKTTASIEEYKKLKQSIITKAVTKGICGNRPMKDSGIEWIGEIPSDWEICKVRHIGTLQNGISKGGEFFGSGFPFVSYGDVYRNISLPACVDGLVQSSSEEQKLYSVQEGDIFFTRTSETIEEVGFSSVCENDIPKATFAGFLIRLRPNKNKIYSGFSKYYFRSSHHRSFLIKEMNLVTRASLGQSLLKSMFVLLPGMNEQYEIAEYLDSKCNEIDNITSRKQQLITELEAYKKSLIYEYVTGKKEVV